CLQYNSDPFSF
nr:immunoglobulin light chain junction region [Macaca mulatta]MOV74712.1 immunoglobulin light chain junction region [Macaca mulatta]MOV74975.1 immunoglobulin light chain junction region [Macaca mulatta]MOV75319.1 immunoglobulin light chain junction region [Macaca mulatta]MOV75405.1 immunoglobulin light chain junction region [Macaca mulatta]